MREERVMREFVIETEWVSLSWWREGSYFYSKEGETNKEKRYWKESIKHIIYLIKKEIQISQNKNISLPNISKNKLGREILLLLLFIF